MTVYRKVIVRKGGKLAEDLPSAWNGSHLSHVTW